MKFIHRLGYYLGGFALGLVLLLFFLNGKEASCDYTPNARTVKNISSKPLAYSQQALSFVTNNSLDSLTIKQLIQFGKVDFGKSDTQLETCNIYIINNSYKEQNLTLKIKNCDSLATLLDIMYTNI